MTEVSYYKTRLRNKGQVTVPVEVRQKLGVKEGDDLAFVVDVNGQVTIQPLQTIPPDQAWFWTERWQAMERSAQADISEGRIHQYANVDEAIAFLEKSDHAGDSDDRDV